MRLPCPGGGFVFTNIAFGVSSINACPPPPDCDTPDRYVMWAKKGSSIIAQSELSENVYLDYYSVPHTVKYILIGQVRVPLDNNNYIPFVTQFDYSYGTASPECGNCTVKNSTFSRSGGTQTASYRNTVTISYPQQVLDGNVQGTHNGWDCDKDGYGSYIISGGSQISMSVYVVKVDIKRNGVSIVSNDPTVSVGEKISLTGTVEPSAVNAFVTDKQWTLEENPIKNYIASTAEGRVVDIVAADLLNTSVDYYLVSGGEDQETSYVVEIGNRAFGIEAYFDVKRPSATFYGTTNSIHKELNPDETQIVLMYGTPNGTNGIVFHTDNYNANGATGSTYLIQEINNSLRKCKNINNTWVTLSNVQNKLDKGIPYPYDFDSPNMIINALATIEIDMNENFSTWLMFKPNTSNSIYVPLRKIDWYWHGHIIKNANVWEFAQDQGFNANPSGSSTIDFPNWSLTQI